MYSHAMNKFHAVFPDHVSLRQVVRPGRPRKLVVMVLHSGRDPLDAYGLSF